MVVLGVVFFILGVALCSLSGFLLVRDYVRRKRDDKKTMERVGGYLADRSTYEPMAGLQNLQDEEMSARKKPGPKPGVKRLGMKDCMPKTRGGRGKKKNTEEEQNG